MPEFEEVVDSVDTESQEEITAPQNEIDDSEVSEEINDEEFSEEADGVEGNSDEESDEEVTKPQEETKSKRQTKAQDAMFAQKRREQEAIQKRREQEAYRKAQLDLLIGTINNFTGEEIKDQDDVDEYLLMKEAEKAGYDPSTELSKYQKQKARDERKSREETSSFDVEADKKSFRESYPDVDLNKLVNDKEFADFAEPFAQKVPLKVIYEQYNMMKSMIEVSAKAKAEEKYKRKFASPGSLSNSEQSKPVSYSEMSDAEFDKQMARALRGELIN